MLSFSLPEAAAQTALHTYELGVEVNGARLNLAISVAATGQLVWSGTVAETGSRPDIQFDTNLRPGATNIILPHGLLVLAFTPVACPSGTPGCTPLSGGMTYAWSGNSTPIPVGSFYQPASTGAIDTDFTLVGGQFNIHTNDSTISGDINTFLGRSGWTLPYDRTTLCALTPCAGPGPTGQFFSAGVQTQAPLPGYTGRRLVPSFALKGSVALPPEWGALTWSVPSLVLRFEAGARLSTASALSITGATLTQSAVEESGWSGVQISGGTTTLAGGTIVERVGQLPGSLTTQVAAGVTVTGGV